MEALRKANDDLEARLLGIERDRDAAAIQLAPGLSAPGREAAHGLKLARARRR